jgi:thiol-disulfide isomerase/thioredoxin
MKNRLASSGLFLAALLVAVATPPSWTAWTARAACAQQASPTQGQVDADAPGKEYSFKLKGLDGKIYDSAEMRGEVVVASFGATWCVPCAWELIAIEELKEEYKSRPVRFLWISIEDEDRTSNALLRHYAKSQKLTIPVLRDADGRVFMQFSTSVRIPLLVFYDKHGRFIAPAQRGMSQDVTQYKQRVRARVDALLKEGSQEGAARAK